MKWFTTADGYNSINMDNLKEIQWVYYSENMSNPRHPSMADEAHIYIVYSTTSFTKLKLMREDARELWRVIHRNNYGK